MRDTAGRADELQVPRLVFDEMLGHAREGAPLEICGVLAGRAGRVERIYKGDNIEPSAVSYQLDPVQQIRFQKAIREEGMRMLAIYHSHPAGRAYPSPKDVELAVWEAVYIIIGLGGIGMGGAPGDEKTPEVRAFLIEEGKIRETGLKII